MQRTSPRFGSSSSAASTSRAGFKRENSPSVQVDLKRTKLEDHEAASEALEAEVEGDALVKTEDGAQSSTTPEYTPDATSVEEEDVKPDIDNTELADAEPESDSAASDTDSASAYEEDDSADGDFDGATDSESEDDSEVDSEFERETRAPAPELEEQKPGGETEVIRINPDPKPGPRKPLIRPRNGQPLPSDPMNLSANPPTYDGLPSPGIGPRPTPFNIFDTSTMPFAHPTIPPPAHLLAERHFHRNDLGGPRIKCYHSDSSKTRIYGTYRLTMLAKLNIDCKGPGQPWIWTGGANDLFDVDVAAFIDHIKPVGDARDGWVPHLEKWRAYGLYEIAWAGRTLPGEFQQADAAQQEAVISAFEKYWSEEKHYDLMVEWGFTPPWDDLIVKKHLWREKTTPKDRSTAIRAQVRDDLEKGYTTGPLYSVFRYIGADGRELKDCRARRTERRATAEAKGLIGVVQADQEEEDEGEEEESEEESEEELEEPSKKAAPKKPVGKVEPKFTIQIPRRRPHKRVRRAIEQ